MLLMGKSTISMAIFHCYVSSPEGSWAIRCLIYYPLVNEQKRPCHFSGLEDSFPVRIGDKIRVYVHLPEANH